MATILDALPVWLINPLLIGFLLDVFFGDPLWLPHPIRLFGRAIKYGDSKLNYGEYKLFKGAMLVFVLILLVGLVLLMIQFLVSQLLLANLIYTSIMVFYGIAGRNLIEECFKVEKAFAKEGIDTARKQLSMIVGRDTDQLTENEIRIATLETLSENLSDGVIAPLFYYALGGVPLMFIYKMVNTMDSMIGYKNETYHLFGKVAAKLDDVLNFVPARLTALLMVFVSFSLRGLKSVLLYGNKHSSPNAGYPEAALAGILNCRFGGPNYYNGELVNKPYIGSNYRILQRKDAIKAYIVNFTVALIFIIVLAFITP